MHKATACAMRDLTRIATAALRDATCKKHKLVEPDNITRALAADGRSAD